MNTRNHKLSIACLVFLGMAAFGTGVGRAGESKELTALLENAETLIAVSGTSTLHDWTVTTQSVDGRFSLGSLLEEAASWKQLEVPDDGLIPLALEVTIPVDSIVSGKSGMDKVTYKSLDLPNHPAITYTLREARLSSNPEAETGDRLLVLQTTGDLTVAGAVHTLTTDMKVERLEDNRLRLSGQAPMSMTDFKIKPPKALLGAVKAGDDVEVLFRWTLPAGKM